MIPLPEHPGLTLLPGGVVWLADCRTLVVADVHLGNSSAFRARGLPVPEGDDARDLDRLTGLCDRHRPERFVIAGDLFQLQVGVSSDLETLLGDFIGKLPCRLILVSGNHDEGIASMPRGIDVLPDFTTSGIRIIHDPAQAPPDVFTLAGHWHPVVRIPDGRRTSLRLPCFLLRGKLLVLPSFGSFTGGAVIDQQPGDRHFVTLRESVAELPPGLI
jgi:uncharacterized protein